jgi:hypothetical protein
LKIAPATSKNNGDLKVLPYSLIVKALPAQDQHNTKVTAVLQAVLVALDADYEL